MADSGREVPGGSGEVRVDGRRVTAGRSIITPRAARAACLAHIRVAAADQPFDLGWATRDHPIRLAVFKHRQACVLGLEGAP